MARKKAAATKGSSKKSTAEEPKPGNTLADKLVRIGVRREQDLVLHLPLRYEDRTRLCPIGAVKAGQAWQVEGRIVHSEIQYRGRRQLVCLIEEGDAQLVLRFFHFYPSQQKALAPGKRVRAFGDVRDGTHDLEMIHPAFQIVDPGTPLPDSLTPVYPTTAGSGDRTRLRKLVRHALLRDPAYLGETLPPWTREPRRLLGIRASHRLSAQPPPDASQQALDERVHPAWTRLKFDELLAQQLSLQDAPPRTFQTRRAAGLPGNASLTNALRERLPFRSPARSKSVHRRDPPRPLAAAHPMQRLLQGDVGSGKTVVAALAALQAVESGLPGRP